MIIAFIIIAFVVVAMYCAMVVAGRSDENGNNGDNNEGDDDMFLKKQICPRCKTGKYTYDLDPKSEVCPYIGCWRRNKCHFYKPLEKGTKKGIFNDFKNKRSVTPPKNRALCGFYDFLSHT